MTTKQLIVALGDTRYRVHNPWGTFAGSPRLPAASKCAADSEGYLYICQRADPPILVLDPDGRLDRSFGENLIVDSHGIFVTDDDRVLVVDRDGHQVMGFDKNGKLLFTLGDREHPKFQEPFNHPTDVVVGPSGDMYVSDGYGNSRVHRFSADGKLIHSWGSWGAGPGEFTTPHGIRVLSDGRVVVGDRENSRLQVFSPEGEYLTEWRRFYKPMDIHIHDDVVYVADQIPRLTAVKADGTVIGVCKPSATMPHGVGGDKEGNLYIVDRRSNSITKLAPIP